MANSISIHSISIHRFLLYNAERLIDLLYCYVAVLVMSMLDTTYGYNETTREIRLIADFNIMTFIKEHLVWSRMEKVGALLNDVDVMYKLFHVSSPQNVFHLREGMLGFRLLPETAEVPGLRDEDGAAILIRQMPLSVIRTLVCVCFHRVNAKEMMDVVYNRTDRTAPAGPEPKSLRLIIDQMQSKRHLCASAIARSTAMTPLGATLQKILGPRCTIERIDTSFSRPEVPNTVLYDGITVKFATPCLESEVTEDDDWSFENVPHSMNSFKVRMMIDQSPTGAQFIEVMVGNGPHWTRVLDEHELDLF